MAKKKKMDFVFIAGIILLLLIVAIFHSSLTLSRLIAPPSEAWGRPIKLGETSIVSSPCIQNATNGTLATWVNGSGVHQATIDLSGNILNVKTIQPSYIDFNRIISYQQEGDTFAWKEGPELFVTTLISETSSVKKVNDFFEFGIQDYKLYQGAEKLYLVCSSKTELAVFTIIGGNLHPVATERLENEISRLTINEGPDGIPVVVYATKNGLASFQIEGVRITADGKLKHFMAPHQVTVDSMTNSGTEDLSRVDTAFSENDLWISYEIGIDSSRNLQGKVFLGKSLPTGSEAPKKVDFKRFLPSAGVAGNGDSLVLKDFVFLKQKEGGSLKAFFGMTTKASNALEIYEVVLSGGAQTVNRVSNGDAWNKLPNSVNSGDGIRTAYLRVLGGQSFDIYFTGNDRVYKDVRNKATLEDINAAVSNNFIYLIVGSVVFLLNIPYFLVLFFVIIAIQAFRSKWIDARRDLALLVTMLVHLGVKSFVFIMLLGPNVQREMPAFMHGWVYIAIFSLITLAAFGLVYLHVRKDRDRGLLKEYCMALSIDLLTSMFLMGPFVFEKI